MDNKRGNNPVNVQIWDLVLGVMKDVLQLGEFKWGHESGNYKFFKSQVMSATYQRAENFLDKTVAEKSGLSNIHEEFKDIDRITETAKKHRAELEKIKKIQENLRKDRAAPAKGLRAAEKEEVKIGQSMSDLTAKGKMFRSLQQRS